MTGSAPSTAARHPMTLQSRGTRPGGWRGVGVPGRGRSGALPWATLIMNVRVRCPTKRRVVVGDTGEWNTQQWRAMVGTVRRWGLGAVWRARAGRSAWAAAAAGVTVATAKAAARTRGAYCRRARRVAAAEVAAAGVAGAVVGGGGKGQRAFKATQPLPSRTPHPTPCTAPRAAGHRCLPPTWMPMLPPAPPSNCTTASHTPSACLPDTPSSLSRPSHSRRLRSPHSQTCSCPQGPCLPSSPFRGTAVCATLPASTHLP